MTYKIFIDGHLFKNADGYSLVGIDNVEIDRDIKKLVDTAKITIPNEAYNTLLVRNGDIIKEGRGVQIYLGYNGNDDLYFQGWIIRIEESNKLDVFCEDQGYIFRNFVEDSNRYAIVDVSGESEAERDARIQGVADDVNKAAEEPTIQLQGEDNRQAIEEVKAEVNSPGITFAESELISLSSIIASLIEEYNKKLEEGQEPFSAKIHERLGRIQFTDFRISRTNGLAVLSGLAKALNINIYFRRNVLYVYPYFFSDDSVTDKFENVAIPIPDTKLVDVRSEYTRKLVVKYNTERNVHNIQVIRRIKRKYVVIGKYNGFNSIIDAVSVDDIVNERVEELKLEQAINQAGAEEEAKKKAPTEEDQKVIAKVFAALRAQDRALDKDKKHFDDNGNLKVDGDGKPKPAFTRNEVASAVLSYFLTTDRLNKYTQVTSVNEGATTLYDMVEEKKIVNSIYQQADAQYINDQYLESKNYNGLSGFITTWLKPYVCLLYTSPSPRDRQKSRMPSSA